jgi:hypothetical protein
MRWITWRRALAVVALIVGVGVGASSIPAAADSVDGTGTSYYTPDDTWW